MAGMAAAAPDRLSNLPDDLLTHILSFTPSLEAASTTALSRRWRRPLWLETSVLNFDHRSYTTTTGVVPLLQRVWGDAYRAHKLCRSRGRDTRKLTIVMRDDTTDGHNLNDDEEEEEEAASVDAPKLIPDVEELRVELLDCASPAHCRSTFSSSVPFAALRVLEIAGYILKPCSEARRAFPCLETLRLRRCRTEIATLQDMINAAPRLADLRLEAVCFEVEDGQHEYRLRCPTATVVVIADLHAFRPNFNSRGCCVKLDAPRLGRFRYANVVTFEDTCFSFVGLPPPYLEHVHLAVHSGSERAAQVRRSLLTTVRNVRSLKLTAYSMSDLDGVLQYFFYNLERLEIEDICGWSVRKDGHAASALVSLLRRCPRVRELRLKFSWREYLEETTDPADLNAAMSDFAPCRSAIIGNSDEEDCCRRLDLHKLCCGCKVDCLRDSLTRVVVEFDMEELTCLQLRLVKFLAKNAVALRSFVVDGGKRYDSSRIDRKIERWRKRRRRAPSPMPAATPHPRWPPTLPEFPPLTRAPDPDPIPALPCSQAPASSVGH